MAIETQLSVFLLNKPGQLAWLCQMLANANVNIRAISVLDSIDHGVVRLVVDRVEEAKGILTRENMPWIEQPVLLVGLPNRPRALAEASQKLAASGVNIEYAYGSTGKEEAEAFAVLRVSDAEKAQAVLGG